MKKVLLSLCVLACLGGCSALSSGPYKDALRRVGNEIPAIAEDIRPTSDAGEMRKKKFLELGVECRKIADQ